MLRSFAFGFALAAFASSGNLMAETPRPAPNIAWGSSKGTTLRYFRGQPVVILIAPSPKYGKFRSQMSRIWEYYRELSGREAVFIAAFTSERGAAESNVPIVIAPNGAEIASAFGADPSKFTIAVIGKDGNIDLYSDKVQAGQRLLDVMINSQPVQQAERRQ